MDPLVAYFSDPLEAAGALLTVASITLLIRLNPWGWPVGIAATLIYLPVFWKAQLYGDLGLYVVFLVAQVYGWIAWISPGEVAEAAVSRAPKRYLLSLLLGAGLVWLGLSIVLARAGGALPIGDGFTTSFALVGQVLQARKWIENWLVWIAVNSVAIGVYVAKGLGPTALLYGLLLGLAIVGWISWRQRLGQVEAEARS
jgi:nicotinamide mononucleotide transporter